MRPKIPKVRLLIFWDGAAGVCLLPISSSSSSLKPTAILRVVS